MLLTSEWWIRVTCHVVFSWGLGGQAWQMECLGLMISKMIERRLKIPSFLKHADWNIPRSYVCLRAAGEGPFITFHLYIDVLLPSRVIELHQSMQSYQHCQKVTRSFHISVLTLHCCKESVSMSSSLGQYYCVLIFTDDPKISFYLHLISRRFLDCFGENCISGIW